ncbi:tetratricopeptide repeat protein [Teladorsagia circumcincta]|uniref:Tetratricopeptide repeat protein n=1 Tax=Teladorsagia circumcincta TaxID=45464 RepID=A0A2G9UYW7_TELCI|nr:tetratricopeptide repeat protein [Teladorsagia circumcincta]
MAVKLSGKQSWLTRMGTVLDETLKKHALMENPDGDTEDGSSQHRLRRIRQERQELEINMANLQQALDNYIAAADELQPPPDENQLVKIEQNIDSAQAVHLRGQNRVTEISLILEESADIPISQTASNETVTPRLAPLQIPRFDGRLWEWDHFWGVFDAVVHKRNFSKIKKLSYMLEALQGPAKDTVNRLQITADNYDIAIQLLRKKYDNQEAVVNQLLQNLHDIQPESTTVTDQINTLDRILPIISQLERKGENTDTQQMRRTILEKFSEKIQRAMLKKKASSQKPSWTTKQLLQDLQDFFEMEAQIQNIRGTMSEEFNISTPSLARKTKLLNQNNRSFQCFYCNANDHAPKSCPRYPTIDQQLQLIRQRNCENCGSREHRPKNCTRGACRQCKEKGHHTSICQKLFMSLPPTTQPSRNAPQNTQPGGHATKKTPSKQNSAAATSKKSSTLSHIDNQDVQHQQDVPQNLINDNIEVSITHTTIIDWLELSETATKLLFRDKRSRLFLLDGNRQSSLLSFCTYVQWVPGSDVIVAQSGNSLHVWYNPALPDQVTTTAIKGEIEGVLRDAERTEVIVQEENAKVAYELDSVQIDFGSALEAGDLDKAAAFLDHYKVDDAYSMWNKVAQIALEQSNFFVAQRCFAALNDYPRARAAFRLTEMAEVTAKEIGGDGTQHWKIRANAAQLLRKFKEAEKIYLENNAIEEAIEMYQLLQKWDEALDIAKAVNYPGFDQLKANYYRTLFDTGQDAKAAELKIADGDVAGAVSLYMKAKKPVQALETALSDSSLSNDHQLMASIASQLMQSHIYDKAGELYEHMRDFEKALECYTNGQTFNKAIQLARFAAPEKVVSLEEQWGDYLVSEGQHDASINHFLEANSLVKAAEAAIQAKEWGKAVQIVDVIQDSHISSDFYGRIAAHYATTEELDRAERLYVEANLQKEAIAMYIKNNRWADAYRLSEEFLGKEETFALYEAKAEELEQQGRYADAEQLYVSIGMSNRAVLMYKNAERNDDVIRLVEKYHGEHLQDTHKRLGMEHEERGDLRSAEEEYLKAGDIKAAINMYREKEMWTDAYRLARSEGGEQEQKQVALLWAKSLGGEAGVKLLNKFGMLNEAIDHFSEIGTFDFAFELARLGAKERLPGIDLNEAATKKEVIWTRSPDVILH